MNMAKQGHDTIKQSAEQEAATDRKVRGNSIIAIVCAGLVFGMVGLSYAAVPLYQIFCQVTGYGGTTQRADAFIGKVSEKIISVSFDSNVSGELNWSFKPKERVIDVHLGEKATAIYLAKNTGVKKSTGEASFNVSPQAAGQYFNKIECFCFTEQALAPGESVEMPVLFFVDPDIVNDPLLKNTNTITLSYTFYVADEDEDKEQVKLDVDKVSVNPTKTVKLSKLQ